jgi:hypothetical protein
MGLLENLKANREQNKIRKIERQEKRQIATAKAQAAYDIEFERNAVKAVKTRAKNDAFERFGQSPKERRRKAIEGFASSMGGLGQIGANMGNPFGNESQKVIHHNHHHTTKSGSHNKKRSSTRSQRSQKQKDPFDFDLPF